MTLIYCTANPHPPSLLPGYLPTRIFYPTSELANLTIKNDLEIPICATFSSLPNSVTELHYSVGNGLSIPYTGEQHTRQCNWTTEYFIPEDTEGLEDIIFHCTIRNEWERLGTSFSVANTLQEVQQTCPEPEVGPTSVDLPLPSSTAPSLPVHSMRIAPASSSLLTSSPIPISSSRPPAAPLDPTVGPKKAQSPTKKNTRNKN